MLSINVYSFLILMYICFFSKGLADNDNTLLLISDAHTISIIDTSTLKETIVAEGNAYVLYLDFHYRKGLIFWSDNSAGTISRIRYPSNKSTTAEVIIHSQTPAGVAVDTANDFLYWADIRLHTISRSNLDGSNTVLLVSTNSPEDIELDIANGWIYYTFNGYNAIGKSRVDGSEIQTIVDNIGTTQNLALDFYEDRIYWTENGNRIVRSAFFDGSDSKIIIDGISDGYPFGIATTQSNVYFSTWNKGELFQLFKNNASASNRLIYTTGTASLMSIKIFQSTESECFNYVEIQNGEKRSTGYHTDLDIDIPISDDEIDGGWYRIMSDNGDKIPSYPPGVSYCGTFYPIWLNGSLPASWKTNSVEACQQTATDICETSLNITISNCGSYYVYYLGVTPENSSYCFEVSFWTSFTYSVANHLPK